MMANQSLNGQSDPCYFFKRLPFACFWTCFSAGQSGYRYDILSNKLKSKETIMARVKLNKQAPEFTSLNFNGKSVSLSDFTDRMNVLLIFNRSFS